MTLAFTGGDGLWMPFNLMNANQQGLSSAGALNAANLIFANIGQVYIDGRPGGTKTISAAGGGKICNMYGGVTFANGTSKIDIGIQDVSAAGFPVAPDGTFDVKRTMTGGVDTITASAWNEIPMTGGSGSKSIAHGDYIAICHHMTARGGADSVAISYPSPVSSHCPGFVFSTNAGSTWANATQGAMVVLIFDDGTYGWLDGMHCPHVSSASEQWQDTDNPDERGFWFRLPFPCEIDAFCYYGSYNNGTDLHIRFYSDPFGTPVQENSVHIDRDALFASGGGVVRPQQAMFSAPVSVAANTDYAMIIWNDGFENFSFNRLVAPSETIMRKFFAPGTNFGKATRNNASGAFTKESPATVLYQLAARISKIHDTAITGGGGGRIVGSGIVRG